MEELDADDMLLIVLDQFPQLGAPLLRRMIHFVRALQHEVTQRRS
jgi:midasin (ATPase involved in ribosome maturation)